MTDYVKEDSAECAGRLLSILGKIDMGPPEPPREVRDPPRDKPAKAVEPRPVGDGEYTVKEGDCISSIAYTAGHLWRTVWDHPANAELARVRKDHHILLPDDRVHIPPLRLRWEGGRTECRHRFRRRGAPEKFRIQLLKPDRSPLCDAPYRLVIDEKPTSGFTNGEGEIKVPIPPDAREGTLTVESVNFKAALSFGALDPLRELSGVQARLHNLGYRCPEDGRWSEATERAVMEFQKDRGLDVSGDLDDRTLGKLRTAYRD